MRLLVVTGSKIGPLLTTQKALFSTARIGVFSDIGVNTKKTIYNPASCRNLLGKVVMGQAPNLARCILGD